MNSFIKVEYYWAKENREYIESCINKKTQNKRKNTLYTQTKHTEKFVSFENLLKKKEEQKS